jgi:two-component system response regulator HupR/HoxA
MADTIKVLAVDDDSDGLFALEQLLGSHGYTVVTASSGTETLAKAESERPDIILCDVMMPAPNGYEVAKTLKAHPELRFIPLVLLTGRDELKDIIFGLDQGADDYVAKPYNSEELLARVHAALRVKNLYRELKSSQEQARRLQSRFVEEFAFGKIIGRSRSMTELYQIMTKVVDSDVPVLVTGESGTGKEVVATALHTNGARAEKAFVVQNCSAFNDNLLESELFGHVKGSFSGAIRDKEGLFEVADGGTFFLDELGEMSPALQVKLLRVLQDGTFTPVGGTKQKHVDVRIIAATNRNLEEMVEKGTFREDLYYRLNVVNLHLPPLRERAGDVPLLVDFFLSKLAERSGKPKKIIQQDVMTALEGYRWPGNIRQLENELQRAVVMAGKGESIDLSCLSPTVTTSNRGGSPFAAASSSSAERGGTAVLANLTEQLSGESKEGSLKDVLDAVERQMIESTLKKCGGNKSEAARQLGISRSNLIAKAQAFGVE